MIVYFEYCTPPNQIIEAPFYFFLDDLVIVIHIGNSGYNFDIAYREFS